MQHDRRGGETIPAPAAHFLVIAVDGFRDASMQHGPNVGLIDTEAEGTSADDDVDIAHRGVEFRGEGFSAPLPDDPAPLTRRGGAGYHRDTLVTVGSRVCRQGTGVLRSARIDDDRAR